MTLLFNRFGPRQGCWLCQPSTYSQGWLGASWGRPCMTDRQTHHPGECSQTGTKLRSPSQPRCQQYLKQLTLQTPASEVLLTGLASSRAALRPSKHAPVCITLRQRISISTSSYFYTEMQRGRKPEKKSKRLAQPKAGRM